MITVEEAQGIISKNLFDIGVDAVDLESANGRVLAQDISSERDQPPFNRVMMDGIAIKFSEYSTGRKKFRVESIQKAGEAQKILQGELSCIEVMTGAVLPTNTDTVIKYEDLEIKNQVAQLKENIIIEKKQNIHNQGSDCEQGSVVLTKGTRLYGPQIGILASNGYSKVEVYKNLTLAVISTGDELVGINEKITTFQIRKSNPYALESLAKSFGITQMNTFYLKDDNEQMFQSLEEIISSHDVIVLSGGVSAGKFDFVPQVLADLKVEKKFHKVSQRPGKPLWFGTRNKKLVFGLPGNPVSALTCFRRYVLPNCGGAKSQKVKLDVNFEFNKNLTYFCPVKVININGELRATPLTINTSGDYGSLAYSDGFIELNKEETNFKKNDVFDFYSWRGIF